MADSATYADTPEGFYHEIQDEHRYRIRGPKPKPKVTPKAQVNPLHGRNLMIAAAAAEGQRLTAIGKEYGITRERVRQIANKYGNGAGNRNRNKDFGFVRQSIFKIVSEIRKVGSPIETWRDACAAAGLARSNATNAKRAIAEFGLMEPIERLFRMREVGRVRRRAIQAIRDMGVRMGRPPLLADFFGADAGVSVKTIYKYFGSYPNALRAAGLPPTEWQRGPARLYGDGRSLYDQQRLARGKVSLRERKRALSRGAPREKTGGYRHGKRSSA